MEVVAAMCPQVSGRKLGVLPDKSKIQVNPKAKHFCLKI